MAFPHPFKSRSLVASASIVSPRDTKSVQRVAAAYRPWQNYAWDLYDRLAEIHYPANFIGSSLSRFTLHIGIIPEDRAAQVARHPLASEHSPLVKLCEEALFALGDHSEILRRYGLNRTVAADGWLYGEDKAIETEWEYLSIREIHADEMGKLTRYSTGTSNFTEPLPPDDKYVMIRFWDAHPAYSGLADGPLNPLRDDCDRLLTLNDSITSRLLSRLSQAGILFFPNTLQVAGAQTKPDGTNGPQDGFLTHILNTMEQSILNRGTGAASIPILVKGQAGEGDKIVHITMDRDIDRVEMELRAELRNTIATGMQLPNETQTSMSSSNHWQTWDIRDSTVSYHLIPMVNDFCAALKRTYLVLAVKQLLGRDFTDAEKAELRRIVILGDASQVVQRANQFQDGTVLSDRAVISDAALRERAGATDDEKPTDDEYVRILGRKLNDPYLAVWKLPVADQIDWSKVAARGAGAPGSSGQGGDPGGGNDGVGTPPSKAPADPGNPVGGPGTGDAGKTQKEKAAAQAETLAAAAKFALPTAQAKVGAKLRALAARPEHAEVTAALKRLANEDVAPTVMSDHLDALDLTQGDLYAMLVEALREFHTYAAGQVGPDAAGLFLQRLLERSFVHIPDSLLYEIALSVLSDPTS